MLRSSRIALLGLAAVLLLCGGCGKDGAAVPGYADPCSGSMGAVLGCPAGGQKPPATFDEAILRACDRLVECGILAADRRTGQNGSHALDYTWCVDKLRRPGTHPCSPSHAFTDTDVSDATSCMMELPCSALGLSLDDKLKSGDQRPGLDDFTCPDGSSARTTTVCDQGLLSY